MRLAILVKLRVVVKNKYVHLLTWKEFQCIYISLEKKLQSNMCGMNQY